MLSVTREFTDSGRSASAVPDGGRIFRIRADRLVPNRAQPRRCFDEDAIGSLADSIARYGLLQPLSVRRLPLSAEGVKYEIIAGERRYRAAMQAGMEQLPCIIINVDDRTSAELALIENIQREGLNMFEQAGAIAALIDLYGMTQEQIAAHLSASQSYVANKLRLLRLSPDERESVLDARLSERHARALLRLSDPEERRAALHHIIENKLSVCRSEDYIDRRLRLSELRELRGISADDMDGISDTVTGDTDNMLAEHGTITAGAAGCVLTKCGADDASDSSSAGGTGGTDGTGGTIAANDAGSAGANTDTTAEAETHATTACLGDVSTCAAGRGRGRRRKLVLHDLRLFYNTIDRALDLVRQSGAEVCSERSVSPRSGSIEIKIMITPPGAASVGAVPSVCEKH